MTFDRELQVARDLAWKAGQLAMHHFREGVQAEDKSDDSPVTIADRECEKLFVEGLRAAFPEDGLLGEEGANQSSSNGRRWIIDPIDGTRDFVRYNRLWANLIALEVNGVVEVGVATFPALEEVYWGVRGQGAWRVVGSRIERLHASSINEVGRAVVCSNGMQNSLTNPHPEKLLNFLNQFWAVRSLGGALDAMYVCAGHADFWLEPTAKPWDLAVIQVIAKEAGLLYFDYKGEDTIYGGNAILCVPALEDQARSFLGLM
jgi:histidinol-phosphatase